MRLNLQEEGLVDRQTNSHPRPAPAPCLAWTAAPSVARSWAAHRAARKVCWVTFLGENCSEVRALTTALLWRNFAICVILYTSVYVCLTKEGGAHLSE
jgi:hypothetical protein